MLEYTGERIIPNLLKQHDPLVLEHIARYYFSLPYIKGRALDISCGSGYGTHMIAATRKHVISEIIGVDIDKQTINYAQEHYSHPQASFRVADALDPHLPQQLGTFNTILSFETLQHLPNEKEFIKQLRNMLNKNGILVLSTSFGQGRNKPSYWPYHHFQLTKEEFSSLFNEFSQVNFYYQRGVTFEPVPRTKVSYRAGIAVCKK
ncbi:class I SAM-dependent methyltransferase [Bacillus thuringiensis]|uniref:class I SAM-dependent methyltransferase n=1 Tax=Bacillus thuringiensis TaxID=1428 RepID=UPI0005CEBA32|nr:class I SAM-dependent methyltransferase [Bacillus thuringiensis]